MILASDISTAWSNDGDAAVSLFNSLSSQEILGQIGVVNGMSQQMSNIEAAIIMLHGVVYKCADGYYYYTWKDNKWIRSSSHQDTGSERPTLDQALAIENGDELEFDGDTRALAQAVLRDYYDIKDQSDEKIT